jgi:threonine 3-dehydrogenase
MSVMLESGLDISPVLTHRFHYSEFEQAFETAKSSEAAKVILDWLPEAA